MLFSRCARQRILIYNVWLSTAPLSPSEKQSSSWSSHVADLVDLHTLVAEHGDVSHGAAKSDSLSFGETKLDEDNR